MIDKDWDGWQKPMAWREADEARADAKRDNEMFGG